MLGDIKKEYTKILELTKRLKKSNNNLTNGVTYSPSWGSTSKISHSPFDS